MTFITAASIEDLAREVAETAMRLGRHGAVLDAIEVRHEVCKEKEWGCYGIAYERYECQLHHHWAAIDEATHRPGVRQHGSWEVRDARPE